MVCSETTCRKSWASTIFKAGFKLTKVIAWNGSYWQIPVPQKNAGCAASVQKVGLANEIIPTPSDHAFMTASAIQIFKRLRYVDVVSEREN